jgi:hypothetical protein
MFIVSFIDVGRVHGVHDGVPHNWFGEAAERCPFVTGESVATVVADQSGMRLIVTGRAIARQHVARR